MYVSSKYLDTELLYPNIIEIESIESYLRSRNHLANEFMLLFYPTNSLEKTVVLLFKLT